MRKFRGAASACIGALLCATLEVGATEAPDTVRTPLGILGVMDTAHLVEAQQVTLRDGTNLFADLIIPNDSAPHAKRGTILIQTPYAMGMELSNIPDILARLVRAGYVIAVVNDRGTQWSEGEYHWMKGAAQDGVDTVKWITAQPWSNGSVGAIGCSSSGEVALALGKAGAPGLKTVVAAGAATAVGIIPGYSDQGVFYTGGVPLFDWAWFYHGDGFIHHPKLPTGISLDERIALSHMFSSGVHGGYSEDLSWAGHLPSQDLLRAIGSPESEFDTMIRMKPGDPNWRSYDFINAGDTAKVPILHIDSWYDSIEVYGTAKVFEYLSSNSPDQYAIIGGGPHCTMGYETANTLVGARPVGDARFDYSDQIVAWFDHWLRDEGHGTLSMPRVQYYPLESNKWVAADLWPPRARAKRLYLSSAGNANSLSGDGRLRDKPVGGSPDAFHDDPLDPVPTHGGGCCSGDTASLEQSQIERRTDVLVYTSDPLAKPLDVAGYVKATLFLSSSVKDTDIAFKLVDVYPDGKAYNILDTMQRLRYREGVTREVLLQPKIIYQINMQGMVVASHFAKGHRLRIEIAGSNFPQYERNLHTGGRNFDETRALVADNVVYHDARRKSFLELPLIH